MTHGTGGDSGDALTFGGVNIVMPLTMEIIIVCNGLACARNAN